MVRSRVSWLPGGLGWHFGSHDLRYHGIPTISIHQPKPLIPLPKLKHPLNGSKYVYIYIYIYVYRQCQCVYIYTYICIYIGIQYLNMHVNPLQSHGFWGYLDSPSMCPLAELSYAPSAALCASCAGPRHQLRCRWKRRGRTWENSHAANNSSAIYILLYYYYYSIYDYIIIYFSTERKYYI